MVWGESVKYPTGADTAAGGAVPVTYASFIDLRIVTSATLVAHGVSFNVIEQLF